MLDWKKPLVARHPDGRKVDVSGERQEGSGWFLTPSLDGYFLFNEDGTHRQTQWTIHNRPAYPEGMTPEEQAEALGIIRRAAKDFPVRHSARKFLAKLTPPVDPLLQEAREACAASTSDVAAKGHYRSGFWDGIEPMRAVLYALRQRDAK